MEVKKLRNMSAIRKALGELCDRGVMYPRYVDRRPINHRDVHLHFTDKSQADHFCIPDPTQARILMDSEIDTTPVWGHELIKHLSKAVSTDDKAVSRAALIELMVTSLYAIEDIELDVQQN